MAQLFFKNDVVWHITARSIAQDPSFWSDGGLWICEYCDSTCTATGALGKVTVVKPS